MVDIEAQVLEWLRSGSEDAADIVDLPWEVRPPVIPISLETCGLSNEDKLYVYPTLL